MDGGHDMSSAAAAKPKATAADAGAEPAAAKKGGKKKLILLTAPALVAAIVAGLWFGGILPPLLGLGGDKKPAMTADGHPADQPSQPLPVKLPTFVEMPEIVANLNTAGKRASFVKLHARLELEKSEDQAAVAVAMPRLLDLFQTYLREMHPDELRGSAGTWRLREELIARGNLAAAPAHIIDVLFTELLIQ